MGAPSFPRFLRKGWDYISILIYKALVPERFTKGPRSRAVFARERAERAREG